MTDWVSPDKKSEFSEVGKAELAGKLVATWNACERGKVYMSNTYYYNETSPLTIDDIAFNLHEINLCGSLQLGSATPSCGSRDDVIIGSPVNGPRIIRFKCEPATNKIIIE